MELCLEIIYPGHLPPGGCTPIPLVIDFEPRTCRIAYLRTVLSCQLRLCDGVWPGEASFEGKYLQDGWLLALALSAC